jgi:5-methylcytosine-specific restriction endonuclease McrA
MLHQILGMTHGEICDETGWPSSAVGNVLGRRCNVFGGKHIKPKLHRKWCARGFDLDQIERKYLDGATTYELGEKYCVSHQIISDWMRNRSIHKGKGNKSATPTEKTCPRCGKTFTTTHKDKEYCSKTCQRAVAWTRRHDRLRVVDGGEDIPLREVYERDHGKCYICGRKTDFNDYRIANGYKLCGLRYPTRDHVIAIHNGGKHEWSNIRLACHECNSRKKDKGQMRLAI